MINYETLAKIRWMSSMPQRASNAESLELRIQLNTIGRFSIQRSMRCLGAIPDSEDDNACSVWVQYVPGFDPLEGTLLCLASDINKFAQIESDFLIIDREYGIDDDDFADSAIEWYIRPINCNADDLQNVYFLDATEIHGTNVEELMKH